MEKTYNPKKIEEFLYNFWEKNGFFKPKYLKKPTFCIMMPPPNITGSLHMGHAFQQTIMDIIIRYNRMQGKNTLWQVGTDHAGIATQILVERKIYIQEHKTRQDYSRQDFIKKIWTWKKKANNVITKQMRRLGVSVDWQREKFTLDPDISAAVKEAFILLYQQNLIYQKKRLVHWDSKLETVVSDLEVEHRSVIGKMWFIRYPIYIENTFKKCTKYIVVSTTRPETILGDTAIAINKKHLKYSKFIGKYAISPLTNRKIPIIEDEYADLDKGTGCVKITPAHDFNDYQVGYRHKLPMISTFTFDGKIKNFSEVYDYKGKKSNFYDSYIPLQLQKLDILSARCKILEYLKNLNLIEKVEERNITIPYSERSGIIIEPILTNQWYLKTSKLSQEAIKSIKDKRIKFIPKQYENMFFSWMNNIEDWCISRQIWWGHRIPAWYDNKKNIYVGKNEKAIRQQYSIPKNIQLNQENDVLDTWFSSGLWTFSTLGWPKKTRLLKLFHSTDVLVSGFDIIFFWIARMIMLTMHFIKDKTGQSVVPFKQVYITGLIRDEHGQKMSKSKGNVIDPLDMIDGISLESLIKKRTQNLLQPSMSQTIVKNTIKTFPLGIAPTGTDALRFTFSALAANTRDIKWDMSRLLGYRNFCNKLWNASRFVLLNSQNHNFSCIVIKDEMLLVNKWILSECNDVIKFYRVSLDSYRFDLAANVLYEFIWNIFCDWYLEFVKSIICTCSEQDIYDTKNVLIHVLEVLLKLAHPIMPFITESIWQRVKLIKKISSKTIMLEPFPKYDVMLCNKQASLYVNWIKKIVVFIRNTRLKMNIKTNKLLSLFLFKTTDQQKIIIRHNMLWIKKIAFLDHIVLLKKTYTCKLAIKHIIDGSEIIIPMINVLDKELEIIKIKKELKKIGYRIFNLKKNISNVQFLRYAPEKVVLQKQMQLNELNTLYTQLSEQMNIFKNMKK
ncbi:MAG: valine--tRNA ligase [Buchnera aphidicola (Pentalonia nigronervosa)]|uniref:Valine--tRNA ligase n=1 Tax=Buchnera aphidicola (Pentalonia nigronervosa) TaxID=1309793 RepID=A0A7H1AZY5_9GAMM|nr:MAG: valine--tRNA ligase [Buchnera aphidicola (Pentalonia nigronervosa)]